MVSKTNTWKVPTLLEKEYIDTKQLFQQMKYSGLKVK